MMCDIFQINTDFQLNLSKKCFYTSHLASLFRFVPIFIAVTFRNINFLPRLVLSVFDHGGKMRENAKRGKPEKS